MEYPICDLQYLGVWTPYMGYLGSINDENLVATKIKHAVKSN